MFINEAKILRKIKSPNVLLSVGYFDTGNNLYLFAEYCNGGDLQSLLELRSHLKESEAKLVFSQLLTGIKAI